MMDNEREMYDEDREELLRLILAQVDGADVDDDIAGFPVKARNTFRRVVQEAGLVDAKSMTKLESGEMVFDNPTLTPRGRKRLSELNGRRDGANGHGA